MKLMEEVVEKKPDRLAGIRCDQCGVEFRPGAIGLVTWLTIVIGAHRQDGGGHEDDRDFCSVQCLRGFTADRHVSPFPYEWTPDA